MKTVLVFFSVAFFLAVVVAARADTPIEIRKISENTYTYDLRMGDEITNPKYTGGALPMGGNLVYTGTSDNMASFAVHSTTQLTPKYTIGVGNSFEMPTGWRVYQRHTSTKPQEQTATPNDASDSNTGIPRVYVLPYGCMYGWSPTNTSVTITLKKILPGKITVWLTSVTHK
jgi:hypothetical protein